MENKLLQEYKNLPEVVRNNLIKMLAYDTCYNRDNNISDELAIFICDMAYTCWLEDDNNNSIVGYTDYLLDAIYEYNATKEELEDADIDDIIEAFNDDESIENALKFRRDNYIYFMSTTDGFSYYMGEDGLYVLNEKRKCVDIGHPMEDSTQKLFDILKDKEIEDMPLSSHYDIRNFIENEITGDDELEKSCKDGIDKYKQYCLKHFITKEDIERSENANNVNEVISLTDIDGIYTDENKMKRLSKYVDDYMSYSYVASLNNGTDYYYKDKTYLAIDKNNVIKKFNEEKAFLLNEINQKYKFIYLSENERRKIASEIERDFNTRERRNPNNLLTNVRYFDSISSFLDYENTKELDDFKDHNAKTILMSSFILSTKRIKSLTEKIKNDFKEYERININKDKYKLKGIER